MNCTYICNRRSEEHKNTLTFLFFLRFRLLINIISRNFAREYNQPII